MFCVILFSKLVMHNNPHFYFLKQNQDILRLPSEMCPLNNKISQNNTSGNRRDFINVLRRYRLLNKMFVDFIMLPFYFFRRVLRSFGFFLEEDVPPKKIITKKPVHFIKLYYDPKTQQTWEANELIHLD